MIQNLSKTEFHSIAKFVLTQQLLKSADLLMESGDVVWLSFYSLSTNRVLEMWFYRRAWNTDTDRRLHSELACLKRRSRVQLSSPSVLSRFLSPSDVQAIFSLSVFTQEPERVRTSRQLRVGPPQHVVLGVDSVIWRLPRDWNPTVWDEGRRVQLKDFTDIWSERYKASS